MPEFGRHPARLAAIAAGEKKWRGPACPEHGDTLRHSSSGQCVRCNRRRSAIQAMVKSSRRERYVKLTDRPDRLAAIARGAVIYWGPLCPNGHVGPHAKLSPRYTRSARCAACAHGHRRGPVDMMASGCDMPNPAHDAALPAGEMKRALRVAGPANGAMKALRRTVRRLRAMIIVDR